MNEWIGASERDKDLGEFAVKVKEVFMRFHSYYIFAFIHLQFSVLTVSGMTVKLNTCKLE